MLTKGCEIDVIIKSLPELSTGSSLFEVHAYLVGKYLISKYFIVIAIFYYGNS